MTTWTSPITFTSTTLTAAQMNTEVRDHLNFLKGALDLLTNSTTADTGNTMAVVVKAATAGSGALAAQVTTDANNRWWIGGDGKTEWGSGAASRDTNLYRSAADTLATDDSLLIGSYISVAASGSVLIAEVASAPGVIANTARVYAIDNGAGKTKLMCQFGSGVAQQLAIEP